MCILHLISVDTGLLLNVIEVVIAGTGAEDICGPYELDSMLTVLAIFDKGTVGILLVDSAISPPEIQLSFAKSEGDGIGLLVRFLFGIFDSTGK